ncbi:MAG: hypothetical protein KBA53_05850 [Thermoclostridium sp.]|nr:hypothetical protein [Thermoclostridium sp.]
MKISNSSIQMEAASYSARKQSSAEQLNVWGNVPLTNEQPNTWVSVDLSEQGKQLASNIQETNAADDSLYLLSEKDRDKLKLLSDFIYALTGKKIKFVFPKELRMLTNAEYSQSLRPAANQRQGWGISYQRSQKVEEREHMSFHTRGVVKTEDGREIKLDLKLNMSRSFVSQTDFSFKAGDAAIDPLVVNLKGSGASLGSKSYEFDLDADGKLDRIAFTNGGSGFLALDKNKNGIVDNGKELFGPSMGNGFAELALHDMDQNGWIDENDDIYKDLSIWMREDGGEPKLVALGQAGVGAIYLGHVESQFSLKDPANNSLGEIRQSGIFLFENGTAGTIQHVDLAI